mmetsp:Transcript_27126/g.63723  ORF Transcript_27126/g.63723 Transcript_27126/m.63723 type:complete len:203 (-) Transcript_27126:61-669(-)
MNADGGHPRPWRGSRGRWLLHGCLLWMLALQLRQAFVVPSSVVRSSEGNSAEALMQRRRVLALLGTAVAVPGTSASAQDAAPPKTSKWTGIWADPDAPGCKRKIIVGFEGTSARILGDYSRGNPNSNLAELARPAEGEQRKGACKRGDKVSSWSAPGKLAAGDADEMTIAFPSSTGPREVKAKWRDGGILFPDNTLWTKVSR